MRLVLQILGHRLLRKLRRQLLLTLTGGYQLVGSVLDIYTVLDSFPYTQIVL